MAFGSKFGFGRSRLNEPNNSGFGSPSAPNGGFPPPPKPSGPNNSGFGRPNSFPPPPSGGFGSPSAPNRGFPPPPSGGFGSPGGPNNSGFGNPSAPNGVDPSKGFPPPPKSSAPNNGGFSNSDYFAPRDNPFFRQMTDEEAVRAEEYLSGKHSGHTFGKPDPKTAEAVRDKLNEYKEAKYPKPMGFGGISDPNEPFKIDSESASKKSASERYSDYIHEWQERKWLNIKSTESVHEYKAQKEREYQEYKAQQDNNNQPDNRPSFGGPANPGQYTDRHGGFVPPNPSDQRQQGGIADGFVADHNAQQNKPGFGGPSFGQSKNNGPQFGF